MMRITARFSALGALGLSVLLGTGALAAGAQAPADPRAARVDSLFARYNATPSPGLAVAVVRDGRTILRRGYGLADIEHRVPITPSTVFDVASVSKQFAGLVTAMLVTEGKLRLTDDVRRYVPELAPRERPITIGHLVHHTSGLRDWPGTLAVGGWRFDDVISFEQILTMAYGQRELNFVPGAEHLYSNTGYNVLTEAIQRVTGTSFREYTDERLFRPLGMTASHFRDDHTVVVPERAFGYARAPDGSFRHTPNNLTALGSSSLFSTVDDLARWLANFDDGTVGGAAAMALMRTHGTLNDGTSIPYAFGIVHGEHRGVPMLSHSGSWASFLTYLVYFPAQKAGIVVLANSGSVNASQAGMQVASIYLEEHLAPPVPASTLPVSSVAIAPAVLDEYAGLYRLGPGWYTRIRRDGASLTTQATREEPAPMVARSSEELWVPRYNASMTFRRDAAGKVVGLDYRGQRAPRVAGGAAPTRARLAAYAGVYESGELGTSYTVVVNDSTLELRHPRHGRTAFTWLAGEDFGSTLWFLRSAEFQRDAGGRVVAMVVNGDARSRNIRFVKRP